MKTSVLAWKLADYKKANEEASERIIENPDLCEGEMMSDEEIEEYLKDSVATIRILSDKGSPSADKLKGVYLADLEFLVELGRLDADDYNDLSKTENLEF